jgi:hypothetical protein
VAAASATVDNPDPAPAFVPPIVTQSGEGALSAWPAHAALVAIIP